MYTGGGPSGVLRPLAGASESADQCDLGIRTERGVTTDCIYHCSSLIHNMQACSPISFAPIRLGMFCFNYFKVAMLLWTKYMHSGNRW